jgi:hypothetical protein
MHLCFKNISVKMTDIGICLSGKMSENTQLGLLEISLNAIFEDIESIYFEN